MSGAGPPSPRSPVPTRIGPERLPPGPCEVPLVRRTPRAQPDKRSPPGTRLAVSPLLPHRANAISSPPARPYQRLRRSAPARSASPGRRRRRQPDCRGRERRIHLCAAALYEQPCTNSPVRTALYEQLAADDPARIRVLDRRLQDNATALNSMREWISQARDRIPCLPDPWAMRRYCADSCRLRGNVHSAASR